MVVVPTRAAYDVTSRTTRRPASDIPFSLSKTGIPILPLERLQPLPRPLQTSSPPKHVLHVAVKYIAVPH